MSEHLGDTKQINYYEYALTTFLAARSMIWLKTVCWYDFSQAKKRSYYDKGNCYEEFSASGRTANNNYIGDQNIVMTFPMSPSTTSATAMSLGIVGIALNGVAIFSNSASPPDDIYDEVATFDKCEGHPAGTTYHYHIEAPSITNGDSAFLGVMRDGIPVYGRLDEDSSTPSLDTEGGHTGTTPDSSSSIYHYHTHLQTSGSD